MQVRKSVVEEVEELVFPNFHTLILGGWIIAGAVGARSVVCASLPTYAAYHLNHIMERMTGGRARRTPAMSRSGCTARYLRETDIETVLRSGFNAPTDRERSQMPI